MRCFFAALAGFALCMNAWWFVRERTEVAEALSGALGEPVSREAAGRLAGVRAEFCEVARLVRPGAPCFYWTLPAQQKTVKAECQALRLNYALWPSRVLYRDDRSLSAVEYILVQSYQAGDLDMRLFEYELQTGRGAGFKEIGRSRDIVVLRRTAGGGNTP